MSDTLPPAVPITPLSGTALSDAQLQAFQNALAVTASVLSQDQWGMTAMNNLLEADARGLNPQQVVDGIQARKPGYCLGTIFALSANTIRGLAESGNLPKSLWLKRVWLPVADGSVVATQVPWNPTDFNGLQVYATRDQAVEASHALLTTWTSANSTQVSDPSNPEQTISKVAFNPAAFTGAL